MTKEEALKEEKREFFFSSLDGEGLARKYFEKGWDKGIAFAQVDVADLRERLKEAHRDLRDAVLFLTGGDRCVCKICSEKENKPFNPLDHEQSK